MNETAYLTEVRRVLDELGSSDSSADVTGSGDYWKHCRHAGIEAKVCAATIYTGERHRHEVARTVIKENASAAQESPVREEWEVVVKRAGVSADDITSAAGRRPDEVTTGNAVFAGFRDDEKAASFSKKMTKAGYISSFGPRRDYTLHENREWSKVILGSEKDARALRNELEGKYTVDRLGVNIWTTASYDVVLKALDRADVKGHIYREVDEAREKAAETPAASQSEVAECASCIPWQKVSRDSDAAAANTELAKKYGAIKNAKDVYRVVGDALNKETQEVFLVIPLDLRGELKSAPYEVARGQLSRVSVDTGDVLRAALHAGGEAFICVHQHPSGKATPSKADRDLTKSIKDATAVHGKSLTFVDHVVIGQKRAYSIGENKMYKC